MAKSAQFLYTFPMRMIGKTMKTAQLIALVLNVVSDVCRGNDAHLQVIRIATGGCGSCSYRVPGPLEDLGVGELQDEAVGMLPDCGERLRAIAGSPHL